MNIRKIIKEEVDDFDWISDVPEFPLNEIKDLINQYEKVNVLKLKLGDYLKDKEGMENVTDWGTMPQEEFNEKYRDRFIVEEIKNIYNEINNIDGSLFELSSPLEHLEYLITGIDTTEDI